ncbi:NADH-quinone oxidoreductase subunit C [bacterium]|nr:NADH-quinone oxidoreductase subunit C [bacterium]
MTDTGNDPEKKEDEAKAEAKEAPKAAAPEGAKAAPAAPAGAKAAAPAGAKAAPAAAAKPAEPAAPPAPLEPAFFGKFLKEHGFDSKRLADHSNKCEAIEITAKDLIGILKILKSSDETKLNLLITISGVDSPDSYDTVYHLWSYDNDKELVLKVLTAKTETPPDGLPQIPSIASFWPAANWHERETYDLVGIRFTGHPYLRRLLNPWDWDGHPLRRDYKQPVDALNDKNPISMR